MHVKMFVVNDRDNRRTPRLAAPREPLGGPLAFGGRHIGGHHIGFAIVAARRATRPACSTAGGLPSTRFKIE
jgi:hypothetical protein